MTDTVQTIRDLMRPSLTMMFSSTFCILVITYAILKFIGYEVSGLKEAIDEVKVPLAMIMTYHFIKSSKKDVKK